MEDMKEMGKPDKPEMKKKKKKKRVNMDTLKEAMSVRNVGEGIESAAKSIASVIKKKKGY